LADPEKRPLDVHPGDRGLTVTTPVAAPDKVCSVVVLEVEGPLKVEGVAARAK
jgi:hypothetical protein